MTSHAVKLHHGLFCALALFCGCASRSGSGGGSAAGSFPSRAELLRLGTAPPPVRTAGGHTLDVERWELAGPLPDELKLAPMATRTSWSDLLQARAASRNGLVFVSEAMGCASRELGRFKLANKVAPGDGLRAFILARCGTGTEHAEISTLEGAVPADVTDDRVFAEWQKDAGVLIDKSIGGGLRTVGIWFGREGGRAIVIVTAAPRRVQIDPVAMKPADGKTITITGELLIPAASLRGLVNHGRFEHATCKANPNVALPRFSLRCPVDARDSLAWIEVAAFPAGRIVGPQVLSLLALPDGTGSAVYERPKTAAAGGASLPEALLAALNGVRVEAGLAPLGLAPRESEVATNVAPHYFAAGEGDAPETNADLVVLGLRAGWDVEGMVRAGLFAAAAVTDTREPGALVAAALDRPSGRETLLDPLVRQVAIGPVLHGDHAAGAVFATYSFFDRESYDAEAAALLGRLSKLRADLHLGAPMLLSGGEKATREAARAVQRDGRSPGQALNEALEATVQQTHAQVNGWFMESATLEDVKFPDALLRTPGLQISLAIGHHKDPKKAWGAYVIFIVVANTLTAS